MTHVACQSKLHVHLWAQKCTHGHGTGWESGVRSCLMPGLPTHLVQDLNIGTVLHHHNYLVTTSSQYGRKSDNNPNSKLVPDIRILSINLSLIWQSCSFDCSCSTISDACRNAKCCSDIICHLIDISIHANKANDPNWQVVSAVVPKVCSCKMRVCV